MINYLKRIIIVLCLVFLPSVCFAQTDGVDEAFKKESIKAEKIFKDITLYINTSNFCFEETKECKSIYQSHVNYICKMMEDNGWIKEFYYTEITLMMNTETGERLIYIILYFKSFIKEGYYTKEWMVPEENKNYVKNSRISKNLYL